MRKQKMKACSGEYEDKRVVHTVRYRGEIIVIENVPAEVCSVCGDVLFSPGTVRQIERLLRTQRATTRVAPVYEFASASV